MARCITFQSWEEQRKRIDPYIDEPSSTSQSPNLGMSMQNEDEEPNFGELLDNPQAFYIVERLRKKRILADGRVQYKVRWMGFSRDDDTWEDEEELLKNSNLMVHEFEQPGSVLDDMRHCICMRPYRFNDGAMIQCFNCSSWFHFKCLKISLSKANTYTRYYCQACKNLDPSFKDMFFNDITYIPPSPTMASTNSSRNSDCSVIQSPLFPINTADVLDVLNSQDLNGRP